LCGISWLIKLIRYSLLLSDTVKIGKDSSVVLTEGVTRLKDVVMDMDVGIYSPIAWFVLIQVGGRSARSCAKTC
jgi:hypothetical protein